MKPIVVLKQAVALGLHDVANLRHERDLDPLRERDDFKEILREAEKRDKR